MVKDLLFLVVSGQAIVDINLGLRQWPVRQQVGLVHTGRPASSVPCKRSLALSAALISYCVEHLAYSKDLVIKSGSHKCKRPCHGD